MDIWHATVYANGSVYDEDRIGREAAQQWVVEKLGQLGHAGQIEWKCNADLCEAKMRPGLTVRVQRRT